VSPKNRGKFGKAKVTAVPETDEFISGIDRVLGALKPHAARLAVFFGVIAVIVVTYTTWHWWQDRKDAAATEYYARAVIISQRPLKSAAEEEGEEGAEGAKDKKRPQVPPDPRGIPTEFASAQARSRAVLVALEELAAEYGDTEVGRQGLLLQGEALFELGRYDDAAARYREYASGGGPEELVLSAREGIGYALEAKAAAEKDAKARQAGLEQALKAFQDMQPQGEGQRRDEALFHQARILEQLGRKDDARKTLQQITQQHPESPLKRDVETRLTALSASASK
jgi:tetratricopeptide (TPR) repeat protein